MYIQMTEEEVRRDVRLAKSREAQVEILSQINGVPERVIRRILNGESWDDATDDLKAKKLESKKPPAKKAYEPRRTLKVHRWTKAELERVKRYRDEGLSQKQIATELGVSPDAIGSVISHYPKVFGHKKKGRPRRCSIVSGDVKNDEAMPHQ